MRLLFVSNLFPDREDPVRGLDNACLLHELRSQVDEVRVIAIRPGLRPGKVYRPRAEDEALAPVYCPAVYLPKVGSRWNHKLMARALGATMKRLREEFDFDLVLGSWLYPDGCALARLAPHLGFRYWLICQGSDAHAYLEMPVRRRLIVDAAGRSEGVITRSADLAHRLEAAGVASTKLHPVYNGVDTGLFRPAHQSAEVSLPPGLTVDGDFILFVGNFLPVKNPMLLLDAWSLARRRLGGGDLGLVMVGGGPMENAIKARAAELGLQDALVLPGRLPSSSVAEYLRAARCLVLSSHNEGVPNVVLEAFASGVPVVSTDVGGISEVLNHPCLGRLVPPGDGEALALAIAELVDGPRETEAIATRGERFSWEAATKSYLQLLERPL